WVNEAPETSPSANNDPRTPTDAGTGFLLSDGWTIVWSGWDGTVVRDRALMGIRLPVAAQAGSPIEKMVREEFSIAGAIDPTPPSLRFKLTYQAANPASTSARLTVRYSAQGAPTALPDELWAYEDASTIILRAGAGPFDPAALYDFQYVARNPAVLG